MKKDDYIYVNWPTGKGGPYRIVGCDTFNRSIATHDAVVVVPRSWCEPIEPKLEDERWYFEIIKEKGVKVKEDALKGKNIEPCEGIEIKPVYRRWEELTSQQRIIFHHIVCEAPNYRDAKDVYRVAIEMISENIGEEDA